MVKGSLDTIFYPTSSNPSRKVGDTTNPAEHNSQVLSPQSGFPAITFHGNEPWLPACKYDE